MESRYRFTAMAPISAIGCMLKTARGIATILDAGTPGEVYNIGGPNEWANLDIVTLLCGVMDERFAA